MTNIQTGMIMDALNQSPELKKAKEKLDDVVDTQEQKQVMELLAQFKEAHIPKVKEHKIGRNDPCPCGSGKKYKNCCMNSGKYENYVPMRRHFSIETKKS